MKRKKYHSVAKENHAEKHANAADEKVTSKEGWLQCTLTAAAVGEKEEEEKSGRSTEE
jgi:hypothetical protein